MQKIKAEITGRRVHDVGYRVLLVNKALSFGVDNFNTFNTYLNGVQAVIVIIEADDETMEEFKSFVVSVRPEKSIVDEVSFEKYRNSVPPVERVLQSFQMEQWGKGIPIFVKMLEKQDKMLELQKETIFTIKTEGEKTRDIISTRFSQDVADLRQEISHIKSTIALIASKVGVEV
jgi:acylphosphatase